MSNTEFKMLSLAEIKEAGYEIRRLTSKWMLISPEGREIMESSDYQTIKRAASVGASRPLISDLGCVLDGANRGHYLARDIIYLATGYGFIVGPSDAYVVAAYEDHFMDDDYPFEVVSELSGEAIEWLNIGDNSGLDRPIKFQNSPPRVPAGAYWEVEDGSLYLRYPDTSEDDCTEHGFDVCPDCGNVGVKMGDGSALGYGYEPCTRFRTCWSDARANRVNLPSDASPEA